MKKTTLIIFCVTSFLNHKIVHASDASNVSQETSNNLQLLQNAAQEKAQMEANGTAKKVKYLKLMGESNGSAKEELNLTDSEKKLSEGYVHQGLSNRIYQEGCSGENQALCNGSSPSKNGFIQAVAKAYVLMNMTGDSKMLQLEKKAGATTKAQSAENKAPDTKADNKENKDNKAEDYCKYIPTATEAIAAFSQKNMNNGLLAQESQESAQKMSLLKASKSHRERAKGAQIQAAGWLGGAACYVGLLSAGGYAFNKGMGIKLAASTFLGLAYQNEVAKNREYAKKTMAVHDSLPGNGACNPVTENACYCAQPETENDPTYCGKELHKKIIAQNSDRVTCVNENLQTDPSCSCEATQTCFEKLMLRNDINNVLSFSQAQSGPFATVRSLTRGELKGSLFTDATNAQALAVAKDALEKNTLPMSEMELKNISPDAAKAFAQNGLPAKAAALLASIDVPKSSIDQAMAKFQQIGAGSGASASIAASPKRSHLIEFNNANNAMKKANSDTKEDFKSLLNMGKKVEHNRAPSSKVVEFYNKAQMNNQYGTSDQSLFDIISKRYMNAKDRIQIDENTN